MVELKPPKYDFGFVPISETATTTISLKNSTKQNLKFSWNVKSPFNVNPSQGIIEGGKSIRLEASFQVKQAAVFVASAVCELENEGSIVFKISGIGKYPFIKLEDSCLDFGQIGIGKEKEKSFTIENLSNVKAQVTTSRISDEIYQSFILNPSSFTIEPNSLKTIKACFKPFIPGLQCVDRFQFSTTSTSSSILELRGISSGPQLSFNRKIVDFGEIKKNSETTKMIKLSNYSQVSTRFYLKKSKQGTFSLNKNCGVIKENGKQIFKITFSSSFTGRFFNRIFCIPRSHPPIYFDVFGSVFDERNQYPIIHRRDLSNLFFWFQDLSSNNNVLSEWNLFKIAMDTDMDGRVKFEDSLIHFTSRGESKQIILKNNTRKRVKAQIQSNSNSSAFIVYENNLIISPSSESLVTIKFDPPKKSPLPIYVNIFEAYINFESGNESVPPLNLSLIAAGIPENNNSTSEGLGVLHPSKQLIVPPCSVNNETYSMLRLSNNGLLPLVYSVELSGQDIQSFSVGPKKGYVEPESFILLIVKFHPQIQGKKEATLNLYYNNSDQKVSSVNILGKTETNHLEFDRKTIKMGDAAIGWESKGSFTITNPSILSAIVEAGSDSPLFPETISVKPKKETILPNSSIQVDWKFAPKSLGIHTADVFWRLRDSNFEEKIRFQGRGIRGGIHIQPQELECGPILVNDFYDYEITLKNNFDTTLPYSLHILPNERDNSSQVLIQDSPFGTIQAKSKIRIPTRIIPKSEGEFEFTIHCCPFIPFSANEKEKRQGWYQLEHIRCEDEGYCAHVSFTGSYPQMQIADAALINFPKQTLYRMFEIDELNALLKKSPAEMNFPADTANFEQLLSSLPSIQMCFPTHLVGSRPSELWLLLENSGHLPLQISFRHEYNQETQLELWAREEKEEPSDSGRGLFDFEPKDITIEKQSQELVCISYEYSFPGRQRLSAVMQIENGQKIGIQLIGETADTEELNIECEEKHIIECIGNEGVTGGWHYSYWMVKNNSQLEVQYNLDISQSQERNNFDFPEPFGEINPFSKKYVPICYMPFNKNWNQLEIPVTFNSRYTNIQRNLTILTRGRMSPAEDKFQLQPHDGSSNIVLENQWAILSTDLIQFEYLPVFSQHRAIVTISNVTKSDILSVVWNEFPVEPPFIDIIPKETNIEAGDTRSFQITLEAGNISQNIDQYLSCQIINLSERKHFHTQLTTLSSSLSSQSKPSEKIPSKKEIEPQYGFLRIVAEIVPLNVFRKVFKEKMNDQYLPIMHSKPHNVQDLESIDFDPLISESVDCLLESICHDHEFIQNVIQDTTPNCLAQLHKTTSEQKEKEEAFSEHRDILEGTLDQFLYSIMEENLF
eukprot:gb/GECH01008395.1/.p1 GENE.gb/GECH01008395.1/~~gb/GECH01008395.1/.p1  ORF type:complete len:1352 (+),score=307.37 gb/GECH01008395.1/:1-4056(+)